ncbi:MAG: NAD(P)/FAD-dependent oxidoreductase, partial [Arenimonas sp.]
MSLRINDIKLPLDHSEADLNKAVLGALDIPAADLLEVSVYKRAYDARKKSAICLIYNLDVSLSAGVEKKVLARFPDSSKVFPSPDTIYKFVAKANADFPNGEQQRPLVIGFGPCGILTALLLAQMGLKPIVLERGQDVRIRTQDTWGLWRKSILNTESNVQFGEGGAGTFSDGKLYSQIKDKFHYGRKVLTEFVKAGAPEEILFVSKPHIGTFKLVTMVEKMRAEIIALGGEIRFGQRVEKLNIDNGQTTGVTLAS